MQTKHFGPEEFWGPCACEAMAQVTPAMWDQLADRVQGLEIGQAATLNEVLSQK